MDIRLKEQFESGTLQRGLDYAQRGLVVSVEKQAGGVLKGRVRNGRGKSYQQRVTFSRGIIDGMCSCPVGHNCKHVVAVLIVWTQGTGPGDATAGKSSSPPAPTSPAVASTSQLAAPVRGWLSRIKKKPAPAHAPKAQAQSYPKTVKDRLLYVLAADDSRIKIEIYKGQINSARTGLNKAVRRYDAFLTPHKTVARFILPHDHELLSALDKAGLWQAHYSSALTEVFKTRSTDVINLLRLLCDTERFLYTNAGDAHLGWSDARPRARLAWRVMADGRQILGFEDDSGLALDLRCVEDATVWIDTAQGRIGALDHIVDPDVLHLVKASPQIAPEDVDQVAAALPDKLEDLALPSPIRIERSHRKARQKVVRLTLGAETARVRLHRGSRSITLSTLTVHFVYDGLEVRAGDQDPSLVEDGKIVRLTRERAWEDACLTRLCKAGALAVEALAFHHPGARMERCDLVFAQGETNPLDGKQTSLRDVLDFSFRLLPRLRDEGWEVIATPKWPYRLSHERAELTVSTQTESGTPFQGNDWFSIGFQAEIGGRCVDVAPLVAAFLEQARDQWQDLPDIESLKQDLVQNPVYLDWGKTGYVALDLSPLAELLHLFFTHYAELGALHPSDADMARLVEEALCGSAVRFSDNAGIIPLARSLQALAEAESFTHPKGLHAQLRSYQAYGAAWMGSLLEAGFGAVLADDMGLGKTVQTLALLQARREAGEPGPALLVLPTSLLHGWQAQAQQFTPDLRVQVLHGSGRSALREAALQADLVITTYPLLVRDRDWLTQQDWPLVILDEAQTLKNPASQMAKTLRDIPAKGRLALTGTPLENSLQDLWTLMDWVNPGLLGDRKGFQAIFRTPIESHGDGAAQARLNRRLRPFLLRRTKEEVATELPAKTEILERVALPKSQQALYETVRSAMDTRVREAISARGLAAARITVLDALLKLRQVCCDPALVKTEAARSVADSAKRTRLRELLSELISEGRRVLVFSQFVEMLGLIEGDLEKAAIPFLTLTGQTRNRAEVLTAFSQGQAAVFLLSLKAGGIGLTLTEADTVILYDPWWNPAVERQAMDRTHRIGQDKPVFVHRLVAAGTVEEKILDMQARKQALADALFDSDDAGSAPLLDAATLHDLFSPLNT